MFQRTVVALSGLFLILLAGCSVVNGSGNVVTDERSVDDFDAINLTINADITIRQGENTFLTIKGEDNIIERVETVVQGKRLTIRSRDQGIMTILRNTKPIEITLSTPNVEEFNISGSGNIYATELKSDNMGISISGSGNVMLDQLESDKVNLRISGSGDFSSDALIADSLEIDISGSGDVKTRGRVNQADLTISGSGTIESGSMSTNAADIRVSGSGEVTIWAKETLDIRVSGSGDVSYYGNPQLDEDVSGSGNVIRLGDKE